MRNEQIPCVSPPLTKSSQWMREMKPSPSDLPPARSLERDFSKPLIAAIAQELWKLRGGNDVLNWLEAEFLLQNALAADSSFDADDGE